MQPKPSAIMPTVRPRTTLYLWEFLLQLLEGKQPCPAISWLNRERGEFVLKDQGAIAELWGKVKGRPQMDKIKLGRAMRYYYKKKLLVKVPRRKAVYRFVKFDALKQKEDQSKRIDYDEVVDVDFNEDSHLDGTGVEKTNDKVLSGFDAEDENDMPLESLLTEKLEESATQDQKSGSNLFHVENNRGDNQENINGYMSNGFIDYNTYFNNNNNNNSIYRGNSFSDTRSGDFEKSNYFTSLPQYVSENNNNHFSNADTDSCVASVVYKSMLVSNDLAMQEQKAGSNFQQTTCGMPFENVFQQPLPTGMGSLPRNDDATDPTMMSSYYFDGMDFDTTLNDAFKELERLVMLNKLLET